MKKAIVIGATGMVGRQLVQQLVATESYSEVVSLVRRASGVTHPKLSEHIVSFEHPESWSDLLTGDVLFSALGTTLAQAKTKDAQYKVDFTYQYWVAQAAAKNNVSHYVLVSSAGANAKSSNFYMSMKGKLEDAVRLLPFEVISILRPGQLDGDRIENRPGERMGLRGMYAMNKMGLLKKYAPILDCRVALAMIRAAEKKQSASYSLQQVFNLSC